MRYLIQILGILLCLTLTAHSDITGTWGFETEIDATECGEGLKKAELEVTISKQGEFYIFSFGEARLKGRVVGSKLTVSGSYQDEGLVTKELEFQFSKEEMKGKGRWTYTVEGFTCGGTETLKGVKLSD